MGVVPLVYNCLFAELLAVTISSTVYAMVAMAEELGLEMVIRSLEHLLEYGEQNIRRSVPLAFGLLSILNPKVSVMDTLSRLSHDTDSEVAMAATSALGLISAGINNVRIAAKDANDHRSADCSTDSGFQLP
jgi:hypothetical protein